MWEAESSLIAARFAQLAQERGTQPAMTFRGDERKATTHSNDRFAYDFGKFWRRVERVTAHLQATWGVQPGDRVAWLGFNHELQLVTLVACTRLGAIFLPLNFRLAVAELQQVLEDAQPTLLVHDSAHAETAQRLVMQGLPQACGPRNGEKDSSSRAQRSNPLIRIDQDTLIATAAPRGLPLPNVHSDQPLLLVYTSGTTGVPKGAVHTQAALLANARAAQWAHGFVPGDKVLSTLPMFHVGGLCIQTLPALLAGVEVVLHPRFDPGAWLAEMGVSRPTLSLLVPATMRALFEHPHWADADLSCLRGIMTGSSTVPLAYLEMLHTRGVPVGQVYGTTETGPVSIVLRLTEAMAHVGASGWPQPEAQVKLVDAQGQEVAPGETGEVCIRAANLMRGYWRADGAAGAGLQDGWFHSGDLGQRAKDGCITIVGRSKDMIISGGENIYPAEIENLLVTLPGVVECAVVGLPDVRWGEVPVLAVVRAGKVELQTLDAQRLLNFLQERIARFKLPRRVVFLDALPKSALGKVIKPQLSDQIQRMDSNPDAMARP